MIHRCLPLLLATTLCAHAEDATALLQRLDAGFAAVFEKVAPAVVVIEAIKAEDAPTRSASDLIPRDESQPESGQGKDWSTPKQPLLSEGSGFIIRADGHIVTNRHVVNDSERIDVRSYAGQRWEAVLVAADERTDIAVLKIEAAGLPAVQWGDSDALRIGQLVCTIGAPFSQHYSFSCGWVSGKGRYNLLNPASNKPVFEDYIQTDAFINPGNSGGPLFDVGGRVVGMNTLVNGIGRGLAFAIPSNLLRDAADQLIATGRVRRPWLGVRITSLESSKTLREQFPGIHHGVVVNTIEAGTPAAKSDLQPGDLVTAVDGTLLHSAHDLVRYVQRKQIGTTLRLTILRKGETRVVSLSTTEQPEAPTRTTERRSRPEPALGLKLAEAGPDGVRVAQVVPESAAARAGLQAGDVITAVGSETFTDPETALRAIQQSLDEDPKRGALVHFIRAGKKSWGIIERPRH